MKSTVMAEFDNLSANLRKRLVDTASAAAFLRCSKRSLDNARCFSKGPPYYKLGGRIYYDTKDLKTYLCNRLQRIDPEKN